MKKILVTGATGFVGLPLCEKLAQEGYQIKVVSRNKAKALQVLPAGTEVVEKDLNSTALSLADFSEVDAVIHLAGESIDGRWTKEKKKKIFDSRVLSSNHLLVNMPSTVQVLLTASAQGIYGDQKDDWVDENAPVGQGFLADVCKEWEKPFQRLTQNSLAPRVALFRLGLVLSKHGGALKKMLPFFEKNLGTRIGSGSQWISWVHREDLIQILLTALRNESYKGVFNVSTEHPVRNSEWTEKLCQYLQVLHMPAVPEFILKMALGEMAELALCSTRMRPKHLKEVNYRFLYPDLDSAFVKEFDRK